MTWTWDITRCLPRDAKLSKYPIHLVRPNISSKAAELGSVLGDKSFVQPNALRQDILLCALVFSQYLVLSLTFSLWKVGWVLHGKISLY